MNNFSDLLATDPVIDFCAQVTPVYQSRAPRVAISLNHQQLFAGVLTEIWRFEIKLDLLDPVLFEVSLLEKVYDVQEETAAVVDHVSLDDFRVIPDFTHLAQYDNDHDFHGATRHVGFVGTWRFRIDEPFYRWRHRVTGQGWLLEP